MYTETKKSTKLLCKKFNGKKITVSFSGAVTIDTIKVLTEKEFLRYTQQKPYQDFSSELFDTTYLERIVKQNFLLANYNQTKVKYPLQKNITQKVDTFYKEFIFQSNQTEGSKIPRKEVENILSQKKSTYQNYNEVLEVKNSLLARNYLSQKFSFSLNHIKRLYHILTHNLRQENGSPYPKGFKKIANVVGNTSTSKPEEVASDLLQLIQRYQTHKRTISPLQLAFDFHLRYEQIHPFLNGNGRTGRLLMNKILLQHRFLPFLIYANNREKYFNAIASVRKTGKKKKYYQFMLEQYAKTLEEWYMV